MNSIQIKAGGPLKGNLRVPGDKSISHRSLLFAALANGDSTIHGLSQGEDVLGTAAAVAAIGADVRLDGTTVYVNGGRHRLHAPTQAIDLGNSGTGARLMIGYLSSFGWEATLTGDASLSTRPMRRVVDPLREMGATISGREDGQYLPLTIKGGSLKAIDYTLPVRSAQVKTAVLLAGLAAEGTTIVREPVPSRAHTEEMLIEFGADIEVEERSDGSCCISVRKCEIAPFTFDVPCDPSAAAFWMVAASVVPDSDVTLDNVYVGPGRGGLVDVLGRMGADIDITHTSATTANIRIRHSQLTATDVGDDEIVALVDEIPVLSVAAAFAKGSTVVSDAEELRVKESDRISAVVNEIGGLGMSVTEADDGFVVHGEPGKLLHGGTVDSKLDHRIAMTGAIAGLMCEEPVTIHGWDAVATSYPSFLSDLDKLRSGN